MDSISGIYRPIEAYLIKIQSRRHSLTHIPSQERPYSGRRKHCIFTTVYRDLSRNLKKLPGGTRTYVLSIHLITCIPAILVLVYLVGVIPRRYALWAQFLILLQKDSTIGPIYLSIVYSYGLAYSSPYSLFTALSISD